MAKNNSKKVNSETGIILVASFGVIYMVNAVVLYLANMYWPEHVVLGTMSMDSMWAILHSMTALALLDTFAIPVVHVAENMVGRMFSAIEWTAAYFVINAAGLYAITRFSDQFGLGVSAWWVILVLAVVLDFLQGIAMMQLQKAK